MAEVIYTQAASKLVVATWLWGEKYRPADVRKLFDAVDRNLAVPHRKLLITDWPLDGFSLTPGVEVVPIPESARYLLALPGCLVRLAAFDPIWQSSIGLSGRDHFLNLDLDMVITRPIDHIALRSEGFAILRGINGSNPCPYNGSVWKLRAGYAPEVWTDFSIEKLRKIKFHEFPDDQGWFWHKMPDVPGFGPKDGVYGFRKVGWPAGDDYAPLPVNACIVAFPGFRSPAMFAELPWVKEHWR